MWNAIERVQRRIRLPDFRFGRLGVTGAFSILALVLILVAGAILDLRGDRGEVRRFGTFARQAKRDPIAAIVEGARTHRFVFLADVRGSSDTKRLAGDAIQAVAEGPGLDAVLVDVGSEQQAYLDIYFNSTPEDASVLLSHPKTTPETGTAQRAYLELYHRIWQLNEKLGADRHVRVIAADLENWAEVGTLGPAEQARRYGQRGAAMIKSLESQVLTTTPRARVFVFMNGLQALRSGYGQLQTGGTATVNAYWFASALNERKPGEVWSAIVDATGGASGREIVDYRGTRLQDLAEGSIPGGNYALPIGTEFDFLSNPIAEHTAPGLSFDIWPHNYRLRDAADLYIHLGR